MKRIITLVIILLTVFYSNSQSLKDSLSGTWMSLGIINSGGNQSHGKYGTSDDFLSFKFEKSSLIANNSPFENGLEIPIDILNRKLITFPKSKYQLPEQIYKVISITADTLILKTENDIKETIYYVFVNQRKFKEKILNNSELIVDNKYILIKHLKSPNRAETSKVSEYFIENNENYFYPQPKFTESFGHFISNNFKFPESFPLDSISSDLVVEFVVNETGTAEEIKIIKGINNEFDKEILAAINQTKNKWIPLKLDKKYIKVKTRYYFVFYSSIMNLNNAPWSDE